MATNLVVDTTIAGPESTSYIETSYADAYWSGHYSATKAAQWATLTQDQKTTLVISATRIIDTARFTHIIPISEYQLHYDHKTGQVLDITMNREPCRYYYYQKLQFPRNIDIDPVDHTVFIPIPVKMATCEQAIYLLNFDESIAANRMQGVTLDKFSVGKGQLETTQQYGGVVSMYAPMAMELIRPFFVTGAKMRRG